MKLDYAFAAKSVDVTPEGLFSVIGGGLSAIGVAQLPHVHPAMAIVVRVSFQSDEDKKADHCLHLRAFNPDGTKHPFETEVPIPASLLAKSIGVPLVGLICGIQVNNMAFFEAGIYEFRLAIDDRPLGVIPIAAVLNAQGEAAQRS